MLTLDLSAAAVEPRSHALSLSLRFALISHALPMASASLFDLASLGTSTPAQRWFDHDRASNREETAEALDQTSDTGSVITGDNDLTWADAKNVQNWESLATLHLDND
jgi:hypothetical protein